MLVFILNLIPIPIVAQFYKVIGTSDRRSTHISLLIIVSNCHQPCGTIGRYTIAILIVFSFEIAILAYKTRLPILRFRHALLLTTNHALQTAITCACFCLIVIVPNISIGTLTASLPMHISKIDTHFQLRTILRAIVYSTYASLCICLVIFGEIIPSGTLSTSLPIHLFVIYTCAIARFFARWTLAAIFRVFILRRCTVGTNTAFFPSLFIKIDAFLITCVQTVGAYARFFLIAVFVLKTAVDTRMTCAPIVIGQIDALRATPRVSRFFAMFLAQWVITTTHCVFAFFHITLFALTTTTPIHRLKIIARIIFAPFLAIKLAIASFTTIRFILVEICKSVFALSTTTPVFLVEHDTPNAQAIFTSSAYASLDDVVVFRDITIGTLVAIFPIHFTQRYAVIATYSLVLAHALIRFWARSGLGIGVIPRRNTAISRVTIPTDIPVGALVAIYPMPLIQIDAYIIAHDLRIIALERTIHVVRTMPIIRFAFITR